MTITEFRNKYPTSAVLTLFTGFFEDHGFIVTAQLTMGETIYTCGQGSGSTVEEAEDKAIQRALNYLG